MRFGLRCVFFLGLLYRAILMSQGVPGSAELSAELSSAVPLARRAISTRVDAYCSNDPAACLADAARLSSLVAASDTSAASGEPRHRRHGASTEPGR